MSQIGVIESWDDAKGFGFIRCNNLKQQVFIHISAFNKTRLRPVAGNAVQFELVNKRGKVHAENARLLKSAAAQATTQTLGKPKVTNATRATRTRNKTANKIKTSSNPAILLIAVSFIGVFALAYSLAILPLWPFVYISIISLMTLLTFAWDKRAARNNSWRISEARLHLLSLLGGWPGALLAQQWLRHKSAKGRFKVILWLAIISNITICAGLVYFAEQQQLININLA